MWCFDDPCTVSIQTVFPDLSLTVHSNKTTISRSEKAPRVFVASTSPNFGRNTTCASSGDGCAATRVKLEKTPLSAGSSSAQATFPISNVSLPEAKDPCFVLVAQNSGVRTSAALSVSVVSAGDLVWARNVKDTSEKTIVHSSAAARREKRVRFIVILLKKPTPK